jgi:hypothetical protein
MRCALLALALASFTAGEPIPSLDNGEAYIPQCIGQECQIPISAYKIPTSRESAIMGRRILAKTKLGTLSTVFPDSSPSSREHRPEGLGGVPIGLMDYVAECENSGNPTILAISIATSFKNEKAGSNISLAMRWIPPYPPVRRMGWQQQAMAPFRRLLDRFLGGDYTTQPDPVSYSAANLPRFSLFGYTEDIHPNATENIRLLACFVSHHPDSKYWTPGNRIHESRWARLVVTHVYWIGGFGDRAYIGWIPIEEWNSVTREEWSSIRLMGESEGWKEWDSAIVNGQAAWDL